MKRGKIESGSIFLAPARLRYKAEAVGVLRVNTADNENAIFIAKAMCEVKMRKCSAYIVVL